MAQNSIVIGNLSAAEVRADINDAFQSFATNFSGSSEPSPSYKNMIWYEDDTYILKMRSDADDAWISIAYLDQTANAFRILDDTQVVNTSGTQTGLIGDQATATWETGTSTTESLVSPAKVAAAISALAATGQSAAKSWASFNGSGTVAFINTYNAASLTDVGTGQYTVGYTNSFAQADNAVSICSNGTSDAFGAGRTFNIARSNETTEINMQFIGDGGAGADPTRVYSALWGDLA